MTNALYISNNAPKKINVLGSFLLSILSGHTRYAHMTSLMTDSVNANLLGMSKVVSDDCARRAIQKIDEDEGVQWLQESLTYSYSPLLSLEDGVFLILMGLIGGAFSLSASGDMKVP